jgi:putative nucleotidyltransferase with HDIG domain
MKFNEESPESSNLRQRVFNIKRLAAMPQVLGQLFEALDSEKTCAGHLAEIIEKDQALSSKVLSLANSAYYSRTRKVTTIERAVVVIGFEELNLMALGVGLADLFDFKKMPPGFDGEGLWSHCLAVSVMARELAKAANHPDPTEVMVAGLLHDVGKLVLATHLKNETQQLLELLEQGIPYYQAEEQAHLQHSILGYWLARRWGLPYTHAAVIRDHHSPMPGEPFSATTCLVFLADRLVKALGFGLAHKARPVDPALILKETKLTKEKLKQEVKKARETIPAYLSRWQPALKG